MENKTRKTSETIRTLRNMADDSAVSRQELVDYAIGALIEMAAEQRMEDKQDEIRDRQSV